MITTHSRKLEALMREPSPKSNGKPLTDSELRTIKDRLARKRTLGQHAKARLDEMHNLTIGKPAPEIDGVDFDGKPLKLSSYRGKVVVLVFWGSWCGPCMREVPHERELVERLKGKPFAMLGVDCDEDKQAGLKAIKDERITWPNWHDGAPGAGPIASRYHIRGYPTVLVLDDQGIIRNKQALGTFLDSPLTSSSKTLKQRVRGSSGWLSVRLRPAVAYGQQLFEGKLEPGEQSGSDRYPVRQRRLQCLAQTGCGTPSFAGGTGRRSSTRRRRPPGTRAVFRRNRVADPAARLRRTQ